MTNTTAPEHDLEALIAWLSRHESRKAYNYLSNTECLLGQWLTHLGHTDFFVSGFGHYRLYDGEGTREYLQFPYGWDTAAWGGNHPKFSKTTFGHALARFKELSHA